MATPYLIADSAQVTVLRSLASTAFGKYGLKLPEGVDLEDVYEVAAPGNELAYVSSLGTARRVGGMFRRFVRADVNITAQGEGMVPASDVERVLDEAAKRVSGDFFLESDISKAGLGPWVPMVDFHVGDIANVEIWGRVVPLVVTRIEPKRTEHSDNDWSVHVGGQLLSDSEARLAENAEIYNAVVSDRRELAGLKPQVSKAQSTATSAKSTADEAKQTADETAALVDGLDIEGSIERAREAVDSSNAILQLVRQLTGAAAAQGAQAQASASLAIEYARQAEEVLDKLDPLRDDVVAAHAEVARLSGEAAKAAQDAAAAVARGEKYAVNAEKYMIDAAGHVARAKQFASAAGAAADEGAEHVEAGRKQVDQASSAASSAQQSAEKSQGLVDEAKALLSELSPLQDAARQSLVDAQSLLDNAGGSGRPLADVLKDVAAKHQAVLSAHDDVLATHGEVLEIHGEAIKYAAMAAAQAAVAAQSASLAAEDALQAAGKALDAEAANRAADAARGDALEALGKAQAETGKAAQSALQAASHNAESAQKLAEADEKLAEADRKLQEQIDVLEESQRLLAQAVRYVAAAAAQAAQAAMSAAQASEENANAIEQTNIAVDAQSDALEALKKAQAAAKAASDDALKVSRDVQTNLTEFQTASTTANTAIETAQSSQRDMIDLLQVQIEMTQIRAQEHYYVDYRTSARTDDFEAWVAAGKFYINSKGTWSGSTTVIVNNDKGNTDVYVFKKKRNNQFTAARRTEEWFAAIREAVIIHQRTWGNGPRKYALAYGAAESSYDLTGEWKNADTYTEDDSLSATPNSVRFGRNMRATKDMYLDENRKQVVRKGKIIRANTAVFPPNEDGVVIFTEL